MRKAVLCVGLVLSTATIGLAQARTVTNTTLQTFKEKRLAADREYRENYQRLGLPSPEELDRQRDADMAARIQLADQLRQSRLEKERLELERRNLDLEAAALADDVNDVQNPVVYGGVFGGFGGFFSDGRSRRFRGHFRTGGGYRATPVGVFPTPRTPRPARLFFRGGHRRGGALIRRH